MTLILNSLNRSQAIQISDRRCTLSDGTYHDNLNKAFVLVCEDARVVVSFTGLAKVGNFDTYRWICETLMGVIKPDYLLQPALVKFRDLASAKFLSLPKNIDASAKRLSIVFSGYRYNEEDPRGYAWLISNFDSLEWNNYLDEAEDKFILSSFREKRPKEDKLSLTWANGTSNAISDEDLTNLGKITKYGRVDQILKNGIKLLQKAANSTLSKSVISKNFSTIVLPQDPAKSAITEYYSNRKDKSIFSPGLLVARKKEGVFCVAESEAHG